MNESLVKAIKSTMSSQAKTFNELQNEYKMVVKMEPENIQAQNCKSRIRKIWKNL